ncbi:hypothetical protein D3C80_1778210 [compost metagenome]
MRERLIGEFINRMTYQDIDTFATKHGIVLNEDEIALIYRSVKENWRTILYGNPRPILDSLQTQIDPLTFQKLESLFVYFKSKYQSFL